MMRQMLSVALICGGTLAITPMVHAKPKKDNAEVADKPGKKKEKKKKEKGEDVGKAKPAEFTYAGTIQKTEVKGKTVYSIVTEDATIALKGKKAAGLEDSVDKSVTISGKGKLMEKGDKKTLIIVKLDGIEAIDN